MRYLFSILVLLGITACNNSGEVSAKIQFKSDTNKGKFKDSLSKKENKYWYSTETIVVDLNNDGRNDTIYAALMHDSTKSQTVQRPDTVWVQSIIVAINGGERKLFSSHNCDWGIPDNVFLANNRNFIPTTRLFGQKVRGGTILLLYNDGTDYNSGTISVISVYGNKVRMVIDSAMFDFPVRLTDLDGDGNLDLVGGTHGEMLYEDDNIGKVFSYDMHNVFSITDSCRENYKLEKEYNESYYVYAGKDCSVKDNVGVFYPKGGGKPCFARVITKKEGDQKVIKLGRTLPDSLILRNTYVVRGKTIE